MLKDELVVALEQHADELARRSIDRLLVDPFWESRYGARGRQHSHEDGRYHVTYLVQSLLLDEHGLMVEYARWLRTLLVARGMCSRHLADNFATLAAAIEELGIGRAARAHAVLATATAALRYVEGPAGVVEREAPAAVRAAVERLACDRPEWFVRDDVDRQRLRDELAIVTSYLADAIARDEPGIFARGLAAIADSRAADGGGGQRCRTGTSALAHALRARLSEGDWVAVQRAMGGDA